MSNRDYHGNPEETFLGAFASLDEARYAANDAALLRPEFCRDMSIYASHIGDRVSMTNKNHSMDVRRAKERENREKFIEAAIDLRLKTARDERAYKKLVERNIGGARLN
jgi:hypothetical protein